MIGEVQYNRIKETNRKKMMREFEYGIKRTFSETSDQIYSVDLRGVEDDPENGIIDDTITVKKCANSHLYMNGSNIDERKICLAYSV